MDTPGLETSAVPLVRVSGIVKTYPGVVALNDVDLTVRAGEVHALTGENGSGKSTLSKVIAGAVQPDSGTIEIDGVATVIANPAQALTHGIVSISQELSLAPTLTVAENIFMGRLPRRRGVVDWARINEEAAQVLDTLHVHVSPTTRVGSLSVELQQEVEIARALSSDARLLILDEATSSLSEHATDRLLEIVEEQRLSGVAVLMISHRMPELYRSCSVATVLRDGRLVSTVPLPATPEPELVKLMVGRELSDYYGSRDVTPGETVLTVRDLTTEDGVLKPTSFEVRRGEILGVAGLVGSGKSELGLALAGAVPAAGVVEVRGKRVPIKNPAAVLDGGLGFVPDDRKRQAILPIRSVAENLSLAWKGRITRFGFLQRRLEQRRVAEAIERYGVVTASPGTAIAALSGGNQQKVVLGRMFARDCDVMVLSEPTRGVDVGSKSQIYGLLQEQVAAGAAVVLISSELPELLGLADRVLVFFQGEVRGEFTVTDVGEETLAAVAVSGTTEVVPGVTAVPETV